jgi:AraC-like DNA-binding protein
VQQREHNSEFGRWQVVQRNAHPRLRAYVHGYFASSSLLHAAVRERHLPSTEVPLLLNFGAPHRHLGGTDQATWTSRDGAWVIGLHDGHQLSEASGERHFMVVRFTPIGAHLFLGTPMDLISNRATDLAQIDRKLASLTLARVGAAKSWPECFDAVEQLVAERVMSEDVSGALAWAWGKLAHAEGCVALGWLASQAECSHRHLIAQFRECVGLPPKTVARVMRFNRAVRSLNALSGARRGEPAGKPYIEARRVRESSGAEIPWAGIAADCGYADQAHLIRDFREFAGSTPARFLREVLDDG